MSALWDAHLRLMSQLTVRTHERRYTYGEETRGGDTTGLGKRESKRGCNGGHNRLAVIIDGERFPSIREAALALDAGQKRIRRMLRDGRAKYAD